MARPDQQFLTELREFIRHEHFLVHLGHLYPEAVGKKDFIRSVRTLVENATFKGVIETGYVLIANSELLRGAQQNGAALLVAGAEGTPESAANAARVAAKLHHNDLADIPPDDASQVRDMVADQVFQLFRCRQLPVSLTGKHPVYLFDIMLTREALFDENGEPTASIPCLVHVGKHGAILALPPSMQDWVNRRAPGTPSSDRGHLSPNSPAAVVPQRAGTGGESVVLYEGKPIPGAETMTGNQLIAAVGNGDRFIRFQRAFSIVLLTFFSTTPPVHLPGGRGVAVPAWKNSILTFLFGWWGIPWGLIRTPQALITNAKGGIDVTRDILLQNLGAEGVRRAAAFQPPSKPPAGLGLWALRVALLVPVLLLVILIGAAIHSGGEAREKRANLPGYAAFEKMEKSLGSAQDAFELDGKNAASLVMSKFQHGLADEKRQLPLKNFSDVSFACRRVGDRLIVFARIEPWRKWSEADRQFATDQIWSAVRAVVVSSSLAGEKNLTVHVALKGSMLWTRLLEGKATGAPVSVKESPTEEELVALFADG